FRRVLFRSRAYSSFTAVSCNAAGICRSTERRSAGSRLAVADRGDHFAETAAVAGGGQTIDHRHFFRDRLVGGDGPAGARRAGLRVLGLGGALIVEGGKNLAFG